MMDGVILERLAISDRAINTCGCAPVSSTNRIVGGKEVSPKGKLPYQVMFYPCTPEGMCGLCGGTIVNKKFVVTSVHCNQGLQRDSFHHLRVGRHYRLRTKRSSTKAASTVRLEGDNGEGACRFRLKVQQGVGHL